MIEIETVKEQLGADIVTRRGGIWTAQWRVCGVVFPDRYSDLVRTEFSGCTLISTKVCRRKKSPVEWSTQNVVRVAWRMK